MNHAERLRAQGNRALDAATAIQTAANRLSRGELNDQVLIDLREAMSNLGGSAMVLQSLLAELQNGPAESKHGSVRRLKPRVVAGGDITREAMMDQRDYGDEG